MENQYSNNAVARDPGTIFIFWNSQAIVCTNHTKEVDNVIRAIASWIIQVKNLATGEVSCITVDPAAGKHYLHTLTPDTYYKVRLCQVDILGDTHTYIDFGVIHTPQASISNKSDNQSKWHIDKDFLLKLINASGQYFGSSYGRYNAEK